MKNNFVIGLLVVIAVLAVANYEAHAPLAPHNLGTTSHQALPEVALASVLGTRTKLSNCRGSGPLADSGCTPGAVFPAVTKAIVCVKGYSQSVRNVPASEKLAVYAAYSIASHASGQYEVDHLISLELGGSNDIANLWPEPADPVPGFHQKDRVENYLHEQVCQGSISLPSAQHNIANNWLSVYQTMPR